MNKRKLVTLTLFFSTFAVLPLTVNAQTVIDYGIAVSLDETEQCLFTDRIASFLEEKGLEEEAAVRVTRILAGENPDLFDRKIQILLAHCSHLTEGEVVAYLSDAALHRSRVDLGNYGDLVSMMIKIKQKALDKEALERLSYVAKINRIIYS